MRIASFTVLALSLLLACKPNPSSLDSSQRPEEKNLLDGSISPGDQWSTRSGTKKKSQTNPSSAYCQKKKKACIAKCTAETLPTQSPGGDPFFKCLGDCMREAGCRP